MSARRLILLTVLAVALAATALTAAGMHHFARQGLRESTRERLDRELALLEEDLRTGTAAPELGAFADRGARLAGARVTVLGPRGEVLADSSVIREEVGALENHAGRPEVLDAAERGTGWSVRHSSTTGDEYVYVARRVQHGPVAILRLAVPLDRAEQPERGAALLLTALGTIVLLGVASYPVVRRLTRPLERMSDAAEQAASGELSGDLPDGRRDEIGRLAGSINKMRRSLLLKIAELDQERGLLASVVGGIREGLLLVGPDRRIRLANDAFRRIFAPPFPPEGRLLAEVVRDPTVIRDLDAALARGEEHRDLVLQAADSGRSFELHVSPLASRPGEALVLFLDVTRTEALERVRREFVADVSHELRTPLTSVKAFVETLLEGGLEDPAHARRFLEIVRTHADRMSALIEDLTDLSMIETGSIQLDLQRLDAAEVAREVVQRAASLPRRADVSVTCEVPSPFPLLADRRRLEQVLVNLVDNAVKFNRSGGTVRVTGTVQDGRPVLAVEDTGVGIPAESLDRVFHRFYRVDRARSREGGGTGLGLAVVKHLMRLHGGQVRVESEVGRGSRFVLEFPAENAASAPAAP